MRDGSLVGTIVLIPLGVVQTSVLPNLVGVTSLETAMNAPIAVRAGAAIVSWWLTSAFLR
jgi:hypothetical protein